MVVEAGSFAWSAGASPTLQDVSLRVARGSLMAVVGTVGSGKSSLLSALLGEMEKLAGRVNVQVRAAPCWSLVRRVPTRPNIDNQT